MRIPVDRIKVGLLMVVMPALGVFIGKVVLPRPDPSIVERKDDAKRLRATSAPAPLEIATVKPVPVVPELIAANRQAQDVPARPKKVEIIHRDERSWYYLVDGHKPTAADLGEILTKQQAEFDSEQAELRRNEIREKEKQVK